jgi:hypothetical protein
MSCAFAASAFSAPYSVSVGTNTHACPFTGKLQRVEVCLTAQPSAG